MILSEEKMCNVLEKEGKNFNEKRNKEQIKLKQLENNNMICVYMEKENATFLPLYGGGSNFSGTAIVNFTCTDTNLYLTFLGKSLTKNAKGNTTYSIYNDSINVSSWVDGMYYVNASVSDVG